jgi:hypothetical protein
MPKDTEQAMLEAYREKGFELVERWKKIPGKVIRGYEKADKVNFLEGLEDDHKQMVVARLMENTLEGLNGLEESTRTLSVGSFEKFVFPIIRAVMANLVAADLVTLHPLDAPTGLVFYFDVLYGSSKGRIQRGRKMFDARFGPSTDYHYTDEIIKEEYIGVGDGSETIFSGTLAYTPVRAGTVVFTDGDQRVVDDGNGNLTGDCESGGTINYSTGSYEFEFSNAPSSGTNVTCDYEYNSEANANIPELDLQLTAAPVTARPNKLRARWSIEAQQDFQAYHGVNAEVEIVAFMANEIAKEINYKIVRHLESIASAGHVEWDRTPAEGVPWLWHKESLYDQLVQGSNLIFSRTQRASANWVVGGVGFCNVVETLSKFQGSGNVNSSSSAGIVKIGRIGEFDVYKDPTKETNSFLMGHKGSNWLDTGYIYAPYLALYTTGTVVLDDMIARKGMAQRTGLKVVNSGMYSTGEITQSGGPFAP